MSANKNVISFGQLSTEVEQRLAFKPDAALHNGICLAKINDVRLTEHEVPVADEDGVPSGWEFAGKKLWTLEIEFIQIFSDAKNTEKRFLVMRETMPSTKTKSGEAIDVKVWNDLIMGMYMRLQHILNAMDKGGLEPKSTKMPDINLTYDSDADTRISQMKKLLDYFYKNITAKTKGDDAKPKYQDIVFWLKVIADPSKGTFFTLPRFVKKGFIEVVKKGVASTLELDANDKIVLVAKDSKGGHKQKSNLDYDDADAAASSDQPKSADDVLNGLGLGV